MEQSSNKITDKKINELLCGYKKTQQDLSILSMGNYAFSIRRLMMDTDLPVIYDWVNKDYAKKFWQMDGPIETLAEIYSLVDESLYSCSFIGCLDGIPVCQLDAYNPYHDPLARHYNCTGGDLGIHLLLGPDKIPIPNFSAKVVSAFCALFFQSDHVLRIVTEPDMNNRAANWLLRRLRFNLIGELNLPEKTANLYAMTKSQFASREVIF